MKINFYTDNEAKAATVKTFLFTGLLAQIMIGQKIKHSGQTYQVNSLECDPDTGTLEKAFVWKYPVQTTTNTINLTNDDE